MQCKTEAYGRGELECMKEGRKVTRCAASVYGYYVPRLKREILNLRQAQRYNRKLLGTIQTTLAVPGQQ